MNKQKLDEILRKHQMWLNDEPGGEYADLSDANLYYANLCDADLRSADLRSADLRRADLRRAHLCDANLRNANLRNADLHGTDLHGADLHGTDLDHSCWPLWCGSLDVKVDARIARQLAYHFCRLDCDDPEYLAARRAIAAFANGFHRVEECGRIER